MLLQELCPHRLGETLPVEFLTPRDRIVLPAGTNTLQSGDNGFVEFKLFGSAANNADTVADARFATPTTTVGSYTRFSAPVIYRSANAVANSIWLISSSDNTSTAVVGSTIFIDDLALVINPIIPVSLSISSQTNVSCNGSCTGTATASASSGTSPYNYLWSNGQTAATATGLCAGSFTVTVTDAASQTATSTATISQPSALTSTGSQTNVSCNGGSNGTATANPAGGTSPYSYLWGNSATTQTISGLSAGTSSFSVTDANGCPSTGSVTITQPTALAAASTPTSPLCNGGNDGSAMVSASGGTSPYSYLWSNGQATASSTGLIAGAYTVTVTDANNCTKTSTATLTEPTTITINATSTNASCGNSDGAASAIAAGGTGNLAYLWSNSATTTTITGLAAGTYTVSVTDGNGCTKIATANVSSSGAPAAIISNQANILCNGGSNGTATVTASGGATPYTYLWNTTPPQTTQTATGLSAGNYSVSVTDTSGVCPGIASVVISEPALLSSTTSATPDSGSTNGTATAYGTGGSTPYSYSWNTSPAQSSVMATGLAAGNYSVTVSDANGCSSTSSATVTTYIGIQSQFITLNSQYSVFPNPAEKSIFLSTENLHAGNYELRISNITGQLLFSENFFHPGGNLRKEIDLSKVNSGVNILQVNSEGKLVVFPIIKVE